jgi:hypothetical protein
MKLKYPSEVGFDILKTQAALAVGKEVVLWFKHVTVPRRR